MARNDSREKHRASQRGTVHEKDDNGKLAKKGPSTTENAGSRHGGTRKNKTQNKTHNASIDATTERVNDVTRAKSQGQDAESQRS